MGAYFLQDVSRDRFCRGYSGIGGTLSADKRDFFSIHGNRPAVALGWRVIGGGLWLLIFILDWLFPGFWWDGLAVAVGILWAFPPHLLPRVQRWWKGLPVMEHDNFRIMEPDAAHEERDGLRFIGFIREYFPGGKS